MRTPKALVLSLAVLVIVAGTAASCTSAAVVAAVARGGAVTFDGGTAPVTITMDATAKVGTRTSAWCWRAGAGSR